ncbi:MAG: zinc-binding dehydrogenase [Sediminicola sp.]
MRMTNKVQKFAPLPSTTNIYRAITLTAPGQLHFGEAPLPEPGPSEVRIKLEGSGVCVSNLPLWEGREWFTYPSDPGAPGHEGWGIIDAVGEDVKGFTERERVTGLTYNTYATHDLAKPEHLVKIPDVFDDKPFPGESFGCAMNIYERSAIQEGQTVAIVGCGFLGLLLIQLAKSKGCKVLAISQRGFSLDAAYMSGADHLIAMEGHTRVIQQVRDLTHGTFCDRTIECTGKEWPLNLSIELTKERGKLIVAGFYQDRMRNLNVQLLNRRRIDMISVHDRDPMKYVRGIKAAILAIETSQMDPFPLFTNVVPMQELGTALHHLGKRPDGFIKALVLNA